MMHVHFNYYFAFLLAHVLRVGFSGAFGYWQLEKAWATIPLDSYYLCGVGSRLSYAASLI